jgi:hypothetical protein
MSARLPDGSIVSLGTTFGAVKAISAISNAAAAVASSTAHGLANGTLGTVVSGWSRLNGRVVRLANQAANTFELEGIDSSNTALYPVGSGAGSLTPITAWTQIAQILEFGTEGGDQQFTNFSFLEQDFESQIPTTTSAQRINISIADDPSLAGYQALKLAGEARAIRPLRITLPDGSFILYQGYVAFNETPSTTKGQVMAVRASFSLLARPVRYAS